MKWWRWSLFFVPGLLVLVIGIWPAWILEIINKAVMHLF